MPHIRRPDSDPHRTLLRTPAWVGTAVVVALFAGGAAIQAQEGTPGTTAAAVPDPTLPGVVEAFFDGAVLPLMANNNSPSGVVVMARGGEVVFAKGYGYQDVERRIPVDPALTLFRPGSVSKLFTWVSVMQLVEAGELDLDTDVNTYLENVTIRDTFQQPVTLRHIMTHTPGFEDGGLGYLITDDAAKAVPLAEAMERYQPERVNPPGTHTAYSNYGAALAGLIVQTVSGVPFNDYVRQNIFAPLGMEHASFEEPLREPLADRMAVSYAVEGGEFVEKSFEIISSFAPAGALSAAGADMIRFANAIGNGGELDGQRILRPETVDAMLTRNFSHDDRMMGMALGFYAEDYDGTQVVGHGGDTQWFHSLLGIDQAHDLTFFVSFGGAGGSAVRSSLMHSFYREFYPRLETPPVPPADFADRGARYAGSYGFWRTNFSTIEKATGLGGGVTVAPTADNTLVVSVRGKSKQYAEVDHDLFREMDPGVSMGAGVSPRLIAFQEDDSGNVTGFVMDGLPFMSLRKLPPWATSNFNFTLLGVSFVVFLWVLLRRFFQRSVIRVMPDRDRAAIRAAVLAAAANWVVLVVGVAVVSSVQDRLGAEIPLLFKLWLVLPIVAVGAGLFLLYRTYSVWAGGLFGGRWARMRYTVVTLCGLVLCWFYWYWNILGFQYM